MNILIVDIDSKILNLALKKIETFHLQRGDCVTWNLPLWESWADKVYVSCVFTENRDKCLEWEGLAEIGGSGYSLKKTLPSEINKIKPHVNLGFTSRGCIRKCPFCVVPEKEGNFRVVGDLLDLWDGKSGNIVVLDNNILADSDHFKTVCKQARENNLLVDFNQGLDHRLLNQEVVNELKSIRHKEFRFSFDSSLQLQFRTVGNAINLLEENGIKRSFWYVLVGYDTSFDEDLMRLDYLKDRGQTAFVQRYTKTRGNLLLGQWANQHNVFKAMTFQEFLQIPRHASYYNKYRKEIEPYFICSM